MSVRIYALLFLCLPIVAYSQTPRVPSRMEFADIKLRLMEDAREEIQKDVDALTRSPKYFNIKVQRAKSYFPIIERVFREEGLHDDFKYLVLQESALIPDAVSVSDAVGFWQFKDFTALEVGLRVDNHVDERMNIVSASRGAARYMKKNNQFFDNWLHTLQAYQMGPGGAMRALGKGDKGAKSLVIDKKTYWYVKKYLAHKIAFEDAVSGPGYTRLIEYKNGKNKSLKEIADETGVSLAELQDYNKWLKKGKIPDDKEYTVIIPSTNLDNIDVIALKTVPQVKERKAITYEFPTSDNFPEIENRDVALTGAIVDINGLPGVIGQEGDQVAALARKGGIDLSKFLKYNDMEINDPIVEGQVYYFKKKRSKAQAYYYAAKRGESLWAISQKFGIRLHKLKIKNRIRGEEDIKPGRVLWLRYIRPSKVDIEYRKVEPLEVKEKVIVSNRMSTEKKSDGNTRANPPVVVSDSIDTRDESVQSVNKDLIQPLDSAMATESSITLSDTLQSGRSGYDITGESVDDEGIDELDIIEDSTVYVKNVHVVMPGETLYAVSKKYGVTVMQLLEWNNLNIRDPLSIDQKLVIMKAAPQEKKAPVNTMDIEIVYMYHTVGEGDTLYKIARTYDVTIEDLMSWNEKTDFNIDLGEKIKIVKRQVN